MKLFATTLGNSRLPIEYRPLNIKESMKERLSERLKERVTRLSKQIVGTLGAILALGAIPPQTAQASITVHDFAGAPADGTGPVGGLVQDPTTHYYYGTTRLGGQFGMGTVFAMNPIGFAVTVIHSFNGTDGADPTGTLILTPATTAGIKPNLVGTTLTGGTKNMGTVFQLSTSGAAFTSLYSFTGGADGANPVAGVIQASDKNLYGTTELGGKYGSGTVYRITGINSEAVIHSFSGQSIPSQPDGANPFARLLQLQTGDLVGTTAYGGSANDGVVFRIGLSGAPYSLLHQFHGTDGMTPTAELIQVPDAKNGTMLYGTTYNGGILVTGAPSTKGTVYRLYETGALFGTVYNFGASTTDGANPFGALVQAKSITGVQTGLYGTTYAGGTYGKGTVYSVLPMLNSPEVQHWSFSGLLGKTPDGSNPYSAMILSADSLLYGTTFNDGLDGDGTLFHISP